MNAAHTAAAATFLTANGFAPNDVTVIGFHGQTLLHRPERGLTVQIGDGGLLAARFSIPRGLRFSRRRRGRGRAGRPARADVSPRAGAANGFCAARCGAQYRRVANVTFIDGEDLIACDAGPGNALLDDFLRLRTGLLLDTDGHAAAAGVVDEAAIACVLVHPFFAKPLPKSLDRNDFRGWVGAALDDRSVEDGAATLTALTAEAVARIVPLLPRAPNTWIVAGGGARNPTLRLVEQHAVLSQAIAQPVARLVAETLAHRAGSRSGS